MLNIERDSNKFEDWYGQIERTYPGSQKAGQMAGNKVRGRELVPSQASYVRVLKAGTEKAVGNTEDQ